MTDLLGSFDGGYLACGTEHNAAVAHNASSLQAKVQGTVLGSVLSTVYTADTLNEALALRRRLKSGESVVTRDGIWLGSDWLRVSRDADPRSGVIEREQTLREIRAQVGALEIKLKELERGLEQTRERVRDYDDRRERLQSEVNRLHREHVDRRAELGSAQSRTEDAARRLKQLESELADVGSELARSETTSCIARRMETAIDALAALEPGA